ncbi:lish protein [Microdochium bolleyi]|uniref:Lish protein n=1 Tax=Microdochium bolleyi TaxID=196109 RepID=A0A136JHH5_9PEZI|nr:lish protein [Microdochium bolleyi]
MTKEHLSTDRINYLVWRYLIEGNYRETAVKFQKEWHVQEPHRELDFARHVQSHALVNVVNKGLVFNSLEREHAKAQAQALSQQGPSTTESRESGPPAEPIGIFGPLSAQPTSYQQPVQRLQPLQQQSQPPQQQQTPTPANGDVPDHGEETDAATLNAANTAADVETAKKRQLDRQPQSGLINGSPAKRPRLSNGYENGVEAAASTPMDLDGQNGDSHAYPSPLEGESAPTPQPRTDGPEQSTQIDKVAELATKTTFVSLGPSEDMVASSPVQSVSTANSDSAPVLLHCQWNPRDPTILAAAGTDALARIWTVSRGAVSDAHTGHVNGLGIDPQFHSLVDDDIPSKATATAMAWNSDGTAIAVATDSDTKGRLTLWSADGRHVHHFEVPEPPIIKIRWNPNSAALLGIAPDNGGTLVTVFRSGELNTVSYTLPAHDLSSDPLDAAWTSETDFLLCGGEMLIQFKCTNTEIVETKKYQTREGDSLTQVQFDWRSSLAATCSEKGFVDIWDANGKRREIEAHYNAVTAIAWQPLQSPHTTTNERLLASGGEDGVICIWDALASNGKTICSMTMGLPIVALAFTPDGAFIAGATNERILIWKVGEHSIPRASWSRTPHPGWLSPRANSESDEEDEHCLGWDSTGRKLAYGVNSRLAVIDFR